MLSEDAKIGGRGAMVEIKSFIDYDECVVELSEISLHAHAATPYGAQGTSAGCQLVSGAGKAQRVHVVAKPPVETPVTFSVGSMKNNWEGVWGNFSSSAIGDNHEFPPDVTNPSVRPPIQLNHGDEISNLAWVVLQGTVEGQARASYDFVCDEMDL